MKLIIDIPEEEYNIIKNYNAPMTWAEHLIAKGTPLQKMHDMNFEAENYLLHCIDEAKSKDWASGIKFALATIEKAIEEAIESEE